MKRYKLMKLLPYLIVASICLLIGGGFAFISQGTSADSLRAQGLVNLAPKTSHGTIAIGCEAQYRQR